MQAVNRAGRHCRALFKSRATAVPVLFQPVFCLYQYSHSMESVRTTEELPNFNNKGIFQPEAHDDGEIFNTTFDSGYESIYGGGGCDSDTVNSSPKNDQDASSSYGSRESESEMEGVIPECGDQETVFLCPGSPDSNFYRSTETLNTTVDLDSGYDGSVYGGSIYGARDVKRGKHPNIYGGCDGVENQNVFPDCENEEKVFVGSGSWDSNLNRSQDPGGGQSQKEDQVFHASAKHKSSFTPRATPKRKGWKKYFKNPYSRPQGNCKTKQTQANHEFQTMISEPLCQSPTLERHLDTITEVGEDQEEEVDVIVDVDVENESLASQEEHQQEEKPWDELRDETSIPNILHNLLIERAKKKREDGSFDGVSIDSEETSSVRSESPVNSLEPDIVKDPLPNNPQDCSDLFADQTRIVFVEKPIDCCCHETETIKYSEDEVCFTFHFTRTGLYFVENGGQITLSLRDKSYDKYMIKEQLRRLKRGQLLKWDAVKQSHNINTGK